MHDLTFAGKIVTLLKEKIGSSFKSKQVTVNITLGSFTHVTEKSLLGAFSVLATQESFKNVCLNIKKNKAAIKCKKCNVMTEIAKPTVSCPKCGCNDIEIDNTNEFVIDSIEVI
jgi:hydrogenase nickel insertion protein HypA